MRITNGNDVQVVASPGLGTLLEAAYENNGTEHDWTKSKEETAHLRQLGEFG